MNTPTDWGSISPQELDRAADEQAQMLRDKQIRTNQIRNLYGTVQRIRARRDRAPDLEEAKEEIIRQLIFLKPKLAYASGRTAGLKHLRDFLVQVIDGVVDSPRFSQALDNFFMLMESIVAYHRYYDPSENSR